MFRTVFSWKATLALCVLVLGGVLSAAPARADKCTLKDIKGVYVATFNGFITANPNPAFVGPFAGLVRVVCDGKSMCAGSGTQSLNGIVLPLVDAGNDVFTVNPDCTGTITVNPVVGPPLHFNTIQTLDGKEAWSIQTDSDTVITGHIQLITRVTD